VKKEESVRAGGRRALTNGTSPPKLKGKMNKKSIDGRHFITNK